MSVMPSRARISVVAIPLLLAAATVASAEECDYSKPIPCAPVAPHRIIQPAPAPAPLPRPAPQVGIARGKTCDYDPHAFGRPDRGVAYDKYNCATSPYGMFSVDWAMGGNPDNKPGKVTILDMGPPPSVVPGCEAVSVRS
jgi:hypothetical protein